MSKIATLVTDGRSVAYPFHHKAPEDIIKVWLGRLTSMIVNPPTPERFDEQFPVILEVCGDFPAQVWTRETRMGWLKQPRDADGRLPGTFWPSIAGLYAYLKEIADNMEWEGKAAYDAACREWARNDFAGDKPRICDFGGK